MCFTVIPASGLDSPHIGHGSAVSSASAGVDGPQQLDPETVSQQLDIDGNVEYLAPLLNCYWGCNNSMLIHLQFPGGLTNISGLPWAALEVH